MDLTPRRPKPPRQRYRGRVTVLRTLAGHQPPEQDRSQLFSHARHSTDNHPLPHSLADQVRHQRGNANVRAYDSLRHEQAHAEDHLLPFLSPVFSKIEQERDQSDLNYGS